MALLIYTGVPGTGKTLYAIQKDLISELKLGNKVYTNIDGLINKRISILFDIDIVLLERNLIHLQNPAYFYKEMEKNSTCILDEAQNIFNNRDWQKVENNECIKYLMEHRHYGHRIIFITPNIDALDAGIRRVAEFTYKHKSYSALGSAKTVKCAIFDQCNTTKPPVQTFTWQHNRQIYDCYKSYFEEGTKERKPRVNPLKDAKLFIIIIVVLISLILAIKNISPFVNKLKNNKVKSEKIKNTINKEEIKYYKQGIIKINDSIIN